MPIELRIKKVIELLFYSELVNILGDNWCHLSNSKSASLSLRLTKDRLMQKDIWAKVRSSVNGNAYRISLWNGEDFPASSNISITLNELSLVVDTFVIALPEINYIFSKKIDWNSLLNICNTISLELGGFVIFSSSELSNFNIENSHLAAYAVFWGNDLSEKNKNYECLSKNDISSPFKIIAFKTWNDAQYPKVFDLNKIIKFIE